MITFKSEFHCNIEWAENPTHVEVYMPDELFARIPRIAAGLKEMGVKVGEIYYAAAFEFFVEDEDAEEPGTLVVFNPSYRISDASLHVADDETFWVVFSLKHSSEQGSTNNLTIYDGVPS